MLIKQPFNKNFCIIIEGLTTKMKGSLHTQSGEFYTRIGTFPTFHKEVPIFSFSRGSYQKPTFFSQLNSKIYLDHLIIFLVSEFYFGILPKLCIVSRIFCF